MSKPQIRPKLFTPISIRGVILAGYEAQGAQLTLTAAGTTMMACPEALMAQESSLLDALARVDGYRIDETGALVLTVANRASIIARR